MKITVSTTNLTGDQVKLLSQLGAFRDERTWESTCEPQEFQEAVDLLRKAGVGNLPVQFGEQGVLYQVG